jgi:hypothetical protein
MWAAIRTLRLFTKSLSRIAAALESIESLYRMDLASRGLFPVDVAVQDPVEVAYGYREPIED